MSYKFERLEVLKKQIQKDKTNAKKLFKTDSFRSFQGFVNIPNLKKSNYANTYKSRKRANPLVIAPGDPDRSKYIAENF